MKRWFTLSLLTLLAVILMSATGYAQYKAGNNYIGVNATTLTEPVGWGVVYEHGYDDNIGLGIIARYFAEEDKDLAEQSWSATLGRETFMVQLQALYHGLSGAQFDPYAGARLGYSYFNQTWELGENSVINREAPPDRAESGITMSVVGGMRYFFSPQLSMEATLEYFLYNDEDYFANRANTGMVIGVNFTLM
ncbi:porin family protein [bacterium]|nr:porin family protein [bacterium]